MPHSFSLSLYLLFVEQITDNVSSLRFAVVQYRIPSLLFVLIGAGIRLNLIQLRVAARRYNY